jgi:hypothetical protein
MGTLRGPGTAAAVEAAVRQGPTAGNTREVLKAIDKGLGRAWAPWHGQDGEFNDMAVLPTVLDTAGGCTSLGTCLGLA